MTVNAGAGEDDISFGASAAKSGGKIEVDLGADADLDNLTFLGGLRADAHSVKVTGLNSGDTITFANAMDAPAGLGSTFVTLTDSVTTGIMTLTGSTSISGTFNGANTIFTIS